MRASISFKLICQRSRTQMKNTRSIRSNSLAFGFQERTKRQIRNNSSAPADRISATPPASSPRHVSPPTATARSRKH